MPNQTCVAARESPDYCAVLTGRRDCPYREGLN
jgi:hypothetical protein